MALIKPVYVALDSSQLGNWARDREAADDQVRSAARDFETAFLSSGFILVVTFHHIDELLVHSDDAVRTRLAFLKTLPLVAWPQLNASSTLPGGIGDIMAAEIEAALHHDTAGAVRDHVGKSLFKIGTGEDALTFFDQHWKALQPLFRERADQDRDMVALTRSVIAQGPDITVHDLKRARFGTPEAIAQRMSEMGTGLATEVRERGDTRWTIMREPSGGLPCVHIETADSVVFSSDIDLLIAAGFLTPRIGWTALARHLAYPDLKSPDTCLEGVSELMPGHAMSVEDRPVPQRPVWSPWDYCTPFAVSEDAATDALEKAVDGCVSAWAGRFRHVLLGISGGLDSSIVAECAAPHVQLSLLTMHTGEAEGDERPYASILAQHLSLALTDDEHRLERVDLSMPTSAHLPRPVAFGFGQSERRTKRDLVEQLGIDALFSGIGGDNVLCSLQSASPIVDRWRAGGPGEALFRTFGDVRTLTGASVWQVASAALRRALKPTAYRWPPADTFLGPAAKAQCPIQASHPWLTPPSNALPGKAAHVAMILRVMATNDGFPRATFPAQINPMISQPIIETCLAIPTWMWVAEGRDRAIARRAFGGRLPSALMQRRTKGGPDSFAYRVMEGNKHRLADILVNGVLAGHGLIDTASIAAALPSGRPIRPSDHMRLASLAEAEVWARHWA